MSERKLHQDQNQPTFTERFKNYFEQVIRDQRQGQFIVSRAYEMRSRIVSSGIGFKRLNRLDIGATAIFDVDDSIPIPDSVPPAEVKIDEWQEIIENPFLLLTRPAPENKHLLKLRDQLFRFTYAYLQMTSAFDYLIEKIPGSANLIDAIRQNSILLSGSSWSKEEIYSYKTYSVEVRPDEVIHFLMVANTPYEKSFGEHFESSFQATIHEIAHNFGLNLLGARTMPLKYFLNGRVVGSEDYFKTHLRVSRSPSLGNVLDEAIAIFIDQAAAIDLGISQAGTRSAALMAQVRNAFDPDRSPNHFLGKMIAEILHENNITLELLPFVIGKVREHIIVDNMYHHYAQSGKGYKESPLFAEIVEIIRSIKANNAAGL